MKKIEQGIVEWLSKERGPLRGVATFPSSRHSHIVATSEPIRRFIRGENVIIKSRDAFENYRSGVSELCDFIKNDDAERFPSPNQEILAPRGAVETPEGYDAQIFPGKARTNFKPHTLVENGDGYFKFYKEGEKILIGGKGTRPFRLLQCLCSPEFGAQKTIEEVFESIRLSTDKNDARLIEWSPEKKTRMLEIITNSGKKELQKIPKLQGKVRYEFNNQKTKMWLRLEE